MKFAVLASHRDEPDCTHWTGIAHGLKNLGIEHIALDCRLQQKEEILRTLRESKPDFILYALSDPLYNGWYKDIRQQNDCPIAFWYCDMRDERTGGYWDMNIDRYVDYVFLSNSGQIDFYKTHTGVENVHFIPQAVIPVDTIIQNPDFAYPTVFIGSMHTTDFWGRRYNFIGEIMNRIPGAKHMNGTDKDARMEVYRSMPTVYGSAHTVLDISHVWDVEKYASNRYYVIPGMGGLSITKRFPGCEEQYPEGTKVYFDTADEAIEKINYYINHKDEATVIKEAALAHCKKHHTYKHRFRQMIDIVGLK